MPFAAYLSPLTDPGLPRAGCATQTWLTMKKIAVLFVALGLAAAPAFACPEHDAAKAKEAAPQTADKAKSKEQPKADKAKKDAPKPAEKTASK